MTAHQLLVFKPGPLAAEQECRLSTGFGVFQQCRRGLTRRVFRQTDGAVTRRGAQREMAAFEGFVQTADHPCLLHDILGTGRQGIGFRIREAARRDQHQMIQAHGFHGARRRTDIAGMLGADQHDADGINRGHGRHFPVWWMNEGGSGIPAGGRIAVS